MARDLLKFQTCSDRYHQTLVKYFYKWIAMPRWGDVSGSVLLGWHEKVRYAFPPLRRPLLDIFADQRHGRFQLAEIAQSG